MNIESFHNAIRQATGGAPSSSEIVPGKLVRFATSDRKKDGAGWCKLFDDGTGGVFGCWRSGISESWQAKSDRSSEDQAAFLVRVKQAKEEAATFEQAIRQECREISAALWEKGRDVDAKHSYLTAKGIKPHGIKQLRDSLLVPIRDNAGTMHGLQFILPDGTKRFKSGTAVSGCYHAIGQANGRILIAEGYATGATLHEITGHAVACAFTAGNLKPVAEALRQKYPDTNGASLRFSCTTFAPVRDRFHFTSRRSQQLITFRSSLNATGFTSPRSLPDRCVGHRIIQVTDQSETLCLADLCLV